MQYEQLPLAHEELIGKIQFARETEKCECQVLSEVFDKAVQRLSEYCSDSTCGFTNARFLKVQGTDIEKQRQLRDMVDRLREALEKANVDMTAFKPRQVATLSVYYALFLRKGNTRPHNGLNRWCVGRRPYIPAKEIESTKNRQEHLASNCMPQHFDDTVIHILLSWSSRSRP